MRSFRLFITCLFALTIPQALFSTEPRLEDPTKLLSSAVLGSEFSGNSLFSPPMQRKASLSPTKHPVSQTIFENPLFIGLQDAIGYRFNKPEYLMLALMHSGQDFGNTLSLRGYERLEFLGDAVLELIMREMLWNDFPNLEAAELAKVCQNLVDSVRLASISDELELTKIMQQLSLGEFESVDAFIKALPESNTASESAAKIAHKIAHDKTDLVESILGALFQDGGLVASKAFVQRFWRSDKAPRELETIFNGLLISLQKACARDTDMFTQPLLRHLNFQTEVNGKIEFLGHGVLKAVLSAYLHDRFPDASEGILTTKFGQLTSTAAVKSILRAFAQNLNKEGLYKRIGLLHLDGGLEKSRNYILWIWTSPIAPADIKKALAKKKGDYDTVGSIKTKSSSVKLAPSPKNLLQDLLILIKETPIYTLSQEGLSSQSSIGVVVSSKTLGQYKAEGIKRAEAEYMAAQLAVDDLTGRFFVNTIIKGERCLSNDNVGLYLKALGGRLLHFGCSNILYNLVAKNTQSEETIYRFEIEGKNVYPSIGEARQENIAQVMAAAAALKKLLQKEFAIIQNALKNYKRLTSSDKPLVFRESNEVLSFYLLICENILHSKKLQPIFEAVDKDDAKVSPFLTFQVSCEGESPVRGYGYNALQAKLSAALFLIDKISPEYDLLKKEKIMRVMGVAPSFPVNLEARDVQKGLSRRISKLSADKEGLALLPSSRSDELQIVVAKPDGEPSTLAKTLKVSGAKKSRVAKASVPGEIKKVVRKKKAVKADSQVKKNQKVAPKPPASAKKK